MSASNPEQVLLPCPFCGTADFVKIEDYQGECDHCGYGAWGRRVVCSAAGWYTVEAGKQHGPRRGCGASTGYQDDDAQAIAAWNRRPLASAPRAAEAVAPWGPPIGWLRVEPVLPGEPGWTVTWQTNRPAQQGDWQPLYQYEQFQHPSNTAKPYPAQAAAADAPPDLGQRSPQHTSATALSVPASAVDLEALGWAYRSLCLVYEATANVDNAMMLDRLKAMLIAYSASPERMVVAVKRAMNNMNKPQGGNMA